MEPRKLVLSFVMISYVLVNRASKVKLSAQRGAQSVKWLPYKCEDLSLMLRLTSKRQLIMVTHAESQNSQRQADPRGSLTRSLD